MAPSDKEAETIHFGLKRLEREASASQDRTGNMSSYFKYHELYYRGSGKRLYSMMAESMEYSVRHTWICCSPILMFIDGPVQII